MKISNKSTREELIQYVQELSEELGYTPLRKDVKHSTLLKQKMGSWNSIIEEAGLESIDCDHQIKMRQYHRRFVKQLALPEMLKSSDDFSKAEMISFYQKLYEIYGFSFSREIMYKSGVIVKRFGSWNTYVSETGCPNPDDPEERKKRRAYIKKYYKPDDILVDVNSKIS